MAIDLIAKRVERHQLLVRAREIAQRAAVESRNMNGEELTAFNAIMDPETGAHTVLDREIAGAEKTLRLRDELDQRLAVASQPIPAHRPRAAATRTALDLQDRAAPDLATRAFIQLAAGSTQVDPQLMEAYQRDPLVQRSQQMTLLPSGGFLVPPERFVDELIRDLADEVFVRRYATVMLLDGAHSLGVPTRTQALGEPAWGGELTIAPTLSMAFGKRLFKPNPLKGLIPVSRMLLQHAPNAEAILRQEMAEAFGIANERSFLTGNGVDRPLGVFVASADGVPTSRDVSAGNTTTAVTYAGLTNAFSAMKAGHLRNARWLISRPLLAQIMQIADAQARPLWNLNPLAGALEATILGLPYDISEFVPTTFTTGQYVGLLADWRRGYRIVDSQYMVMQRLVERFAETSQDGFLLEVHTDGSPVLAQAFVRIRLA